MLSIITLSCLVVGIFAAVSNVRTNRFHLLAYDRKYLVSCRFNPFPNKPWILRVCTSSLLKTLWENDKLLVTSNFSFPTVFSTVVENILPFSSNIKCRLQTLSVWKSLKFVVWERVKQYKSPDWVKVCVLQFRFIID